jgi:hypothetical protein
VHVHRFCPDPLYSIHPHRLDPILFVDFQVRQTGAGRS